MYLVFLAQPVTIFLLSDYLMDRSVVLLPWAIFAVVQFSSGIDIVQPDKLVTTGIFAVSRNSIYVAFLLSWRSVPDCSVVVLCELFLRCCAADS